MGKIGKALGLSMPSLPSVDDSDDSDMGDEPMPESKEDTGVGKAEVLAMKQFERATTPEAKAQALKDFMEACGVYGS